MQAKNPTATQSRSELHDTLRKPVSVGSLNGLTSFARRIDHRTPSQRSANARVSETAMHALAVAHDTLLAAEKRGIGDHLSPSQRSADVPTAMHASADVHEMPLRTSFAPARGSRQIAQRRPFQRSTSASGARLPPMLVLPTSTHILSVAHDTETFCTNLFGPTPGGVGVS